MKNADEKILDLFIFLKKKRKTNLKLICEVVLTTYVYRGRGLNPKLSACKANVLINFAIAATNFNIIVVIDQGFGISDIQRIKTPDP